SPLRSSCLVSSRSSTSLQRRKTAWGPAPLAITISSKTGNGQGDALYRAVVDTAVDAIVVIDSRGTIRSVNRAAEKIFGYRPNELVGRNVNMLMPEPYAAAHDSYLANYRRTGIKKIIGIGREVSGRRKDGSVFPMDLSVGETRDGDETIFVGIIRDITERKAAENALRESELRWRSIVETVPDAIIVIDAQGTVQTFSPAAERLFGYPADEVIGRNVKMLMPAPYREAHDDYLARYLRTRERRIIGIGRIVVGQRKDGETFPMQLAVGEFAAPGGSFFTGFVRDLTERRVRRHQRVRTAAAGRHSGYGDRLRPRGRRCRLPAPLREFRPPLPARSS